MAAKSTTSIQTENLKDIDVEIIANPFAIISSEINMALVSPNMFKLEKWLYGIDDLVATLPVFPKGRYIICGYGRLGRKIYEKLSCNNIDVQLVEIDGNKALRYNEEEMSNLTFANADDKYTLQNVGVETASAIIASTNNDTVNLSILATAKKLNPDIMTIVRENEMDDFSIFKNANIDHIFMPSKILINKTTNALIKPLSDRFLRMIIKKDEQFATLLVKRLLQEINENPLTFELVINEKTSPEIFKHLGKDEKSLSLDILRRSLHNQESSNNVVPLLLQRDEEYILLPEWDEKISIDDKILMACDENAKDDIEYISSNIYEFYYALTGKEKETIFKRN